MNGCCEYNYQDEYNSIIGALRKDGKRITYQREKIVQALLEFQRPFTAESIYETVETLGIDIATIYRNLSTLIDLNLLSPTYFSEGATLYEYLPQRSQEHHHHIVCRLCRSVEQIPRCLVSKQEKALLKLGYTQISHRLEFFAICPSCAG